MYGVTVPFSAKRATYVESTSDRSSNHHEITASGNDRSDCGHTTTNNEINHMIGHGLHKNEPEYFVIKMGDHPLALSPKRRDWHLTPLQSGAILLLAMGALTALVIWLIVSHSQP